MKELTLEVCVVTHGGDGGRRLEKMELPQLPRVSYLVSWQERGEEPIPESIATRTDIRLLDQEGFGSSRNRNNCLEHATGDILLFADDDLTLYPEGLQQVISMFEQHPEVDYGSFCYDSDVPKHYPEQEVGLARLPKNFYQTTFEIALRRESAAGRLRFSEAHGFAVDDFTGGEDELFLWRARKQGVNCRFFPIKIAYHPGATSGVRPILPRGIILTQGALTILEYPWTALPRLVLGAWRIWRRGQASLPKALWLLGAGAIKELHTHKGAKYINRPL